MAQSDPKDTVYNTKDLSKWFAIGSLILLVAVIWAVLEDYDRQWKDYARQSHKIAAAIGERKLKIAQGAMDKTRLVSLEKKIEDKENEIKKISQEFDKGIKKLQDRFYKVNQIYQNEKGELDAMLFTLETKIKKQAKDAPKLEKEYKQKQIEVDALKLKADAAEKEVNLALTQNEKLHAEVKALNDELMALNRDRDRLQKTISQNEVNLGNLIRNAPVVDFVTPTVKINQVILPHLKDDYFFNKVPRVDRCMTCHATIDKAGFEDFPQPFTTHPKLDLMVGPNSKHPAEKVGCTVCHAGVPQSVDFNGAAHTPKDITQEHEWESKYGYFHNKYINTPMVPTPMTEGKCIQCHAGQVELKDAPTYNAGMRLIERYGCYNCHKFAGHFERLAKERKTGPSLKRIAGKLNPEWVKKWLWEPKSFRPTTMMPQYWQTHNNSDPASIARGKVEVDAITAYLFNKSTAYEPIKMASNAMGDANRGKELVSSIGCLGCHAVNDFPRKNFANPTDIGYMDPRIPMFGPELNQMGSKVNDQWLYSWLINPRHYWDNSAMPSMKLSDSEAKDIAAFLLEKRNPVFESLPVPEANDEVRDVLVRGYLESQSSRSEAKTKLASMSLKDKQLFLGEKLISHYGCYACHAIGGFEEAPNIGAELTFEGSKDVSKFAYENVEIPHTNRADWIYTKIRTPRIWDVGKVRDFEGKARMPHFGFTHEQAQAIASIVIGHENKKVDDEALPKMNASREMTNEGLRVVHRYNCVGCHALEPNLPSGYIYAHYPDDRTMGPPLLYTQGRKTQATWLYDYLMNPNVMIRPWVKVRMPQFYMSGEDASKITKYFAGRDGAQYPFVEKHANDLSSQDIANARTIVDKLACLTCHAPVAPGGNVSTAAPHFANVKRRLNGPWVEEWIRDPQAIMPGTRMPTLWPSTDEENPHAPRIGVEGILGGDATKQMQLVRDYLFIYEGQETYPSRRRAMVQSMTSMPATAGTTDSAQTTGKTEKTQEAAR